MPKHDDVPDFDLPAVPPVEVRKEEAQKKKPQKPRIHISDSTCVSCEG